MSLIAYLGGTAVGVKRIRMRAAGDNGIPGLSQNANGESAQGGIIFEDPAETMTVTGWEPVVVDESACVGHERIFTGYVADRVYGRGTHYRADSERQIDTTINDTMVLLQTGLLLAADSPNRPAETDAQRLNWLFTTDTINGRIFDLGLVNPIGLHYDATNFLHQSAFDVLNDLCAPRGNIFFTYWDDDEGKIGLYYDTPIVTAFTSDLTFSNVPEDLVLDTDGEPAGPCYFAYLDPTMRTRPDEVYCQVIYVYAGGTIMVHDQTTHDFFFSTGGPGNVPDIGHRAILVENNKVGKASTATSFANRLLEHYSVERQEVTFVSRIRAADIGLIRPGMRTGIRFDHLPDLSSQQYWRVQEMTISQSEGRRDWYDAQIVASVHGLGLPPGTGGGSTLPFPDHPQDHYASGRIDFTSEGSGTSGGPTVGVPFGSNDTVLVTGDVTVAMLLGKTYNYHFLFTLNALDLDTGHDVGLASTATPSTWGSLHLVAAGGDTTILYEGAFGPVSSPDAATSPFYVVASAAGAGHTHRAASLEWWIDPDDWDSSTSPPQNGQEVPDEFVAEGDGTTTTFTTNYPYVPGSLKVKVDGVPIINGLTETDPTTGSFTLDFAPAGAVGDSPAEVVTVTYQAGAGGLVATFPGTGANTQSAFEALLKDMSIDILEVEAGTYSGWHIGGSSPNPKFYIDRSSRPLLVRPAAGAAVIWDDTGGVTGDGWLYLGDWTNGAHITAGITFDPSGTGGSFTVQHYALASQGIVSTYSTHHCAVNGIHTKNLTGVSGGNLSWNVYVSEASSTPVAGHDLQFNNWNVEASTSKNVSGFQSYHNGHTNITARNWTIDGSHQAMLAWGNSTGFLFDGWTITNCDYPINTDGNAAGIASHNTSTSSSNAPIILAPFIDGPGNSWS